MKKEKGQKELNSLEECFSLKDKNVVIMGGAGKMAESFSSALLSAGCKRLVLADIHTKRLNAVTGKLKKTFGDCKVIGLRCDASSEEQIARFVQRLQKDIRKVDVVIYAVMSKPTDYYAPFTKYKFSAWQDVLNANLTGAFLSTQRLLPLMNPSSSIIFIGSIYGIAAPDLRIYKNVKSNMYGGRYPLSAPAVYSASKSGLTGLCKYLAVYLAKRNIRVNLLIPGGVYDNQDKTFYKEYVKRVPLGRMATWSDYNGALLFLATSASRYMTGQTLIVDGGWTVW
ncbi:MAG: SDR family oxidoreductase [Candidatus Omnitrophota bacterium]|nr:MAG: SDR family oxidoreductase [Candidatus Omnitrophota bacterium]